MGKSLVHLLEEVPPTLPETIPDSCDEDSADDSPPQPKPLTESRSLAGNYTPKYRTPNASSSSKGWSSGIKVQTSIGRGGRTIVTAVREDDVTRYYTVQWRKPQYKKHKTWDGDALLKIVGKKIHMTSEDGDHMASSNLIGDDPVSGSEMRIGQYEVEVDSEITESEYRQQATCINKASARSIPAYSASHYAKPFKAPTQTHVARPRSGPLHIPNGYTDIKKDLAAPDTDRTNSPESSRSAGVGTKAISASNFYGQKKPKGEKIVIGEKSSKQRLEWGGALNDPRAEGAVVMQRPPEREAKKRNADIVDVVLDPFLTSKMRAHQREGVKFMYSCVMGLTEAEAEGCILADEMGLGKTLQTIALIHTLLKQSPYSNQSSIIGKALIVCPVSLVDNWKKEFRKWVRSDQLTVVAADGNDGAIKAFTHHRSQHVLVIGYERLRKVIKDLAACQPPIDLIVCDEGHRLKSKDNKTTKMFEQLRTRRRIILSGTPVQNDLSEYFAMVDFTCPGLLGTYPQFVKHYERPIMKSRNTGCSEAALEEGRERADELAKLSREFILRRTADVLDNYLPPKHEYVVFVAPSIHQLKALGRMFNPDLMGSILRGEADKQALGYIDLMRKIANTPTILRLKKQDDSRSEHLVNVTAAALQDLPSDMNTYDVNASGKLFALDRLLHLIHTTTEEKTVIVSNFTVTLNVIQEVCKKKKYPFLRLDGSTPQKQRLELVDSFNRSKRSESSVFLLSAKAGGVGLNLIGASRLILFDSDWNPSTDLQAMARIHRDGQKKPVYIYRFLTTNSIDEKIYQRQITKTGLADQMMDQNASAEKTRDSFTAAELRDLFKVNVLTDGCQTHDLLMCDCSPATSAATSKATSPSVGASGSDDDEEQDTRGFMPASQFNPEPTSKMQRKAAAEQKEKLAALKKWTHIDAFKKESFTDVADALLYNILFEDYDARADLRALEENGVEMIDEEDDEEEDAPRPKKAKKSTDLDNLFLSDGEDEDHVFDNALAGAIEKEKAKKAPAESIADSADEYDLTERASRSSRKRKVSSKRKAKANSKARSAKIVNAEGNRLHDLRDMAEKGQAGRLMFVFEKVSDSKM